MCGLLGELQRRREFLSSVSKDARKSRDMLPRDSQSMSGLFADNDDVSVCVHHVTGNRSVYVDDYVVVRCTAVAGSEAPCRRFRIEFVVSRRRDNFR